MIIFTKYSNERREQFRIRTDICEDEEGCRTIRKTAAVPQAWQHISKLQEQYLWLRSDLKGTGLSVNVCESCQGGVSFPYLNGRTFEELLDELLAKNRISELTEKIGAYFSMFSCEEPFAVTPQFTEVFGEVSFDRPQHSRAVSDIDMIFGNAIETEDGFELIDYEWTFDFPVPVKFIWYRCLYYYILGNAKRDALTKLDLFGHFGISETQCQQFAAMEDHFQQYILGSYTPVWKQYDAISDGIIEVMPLVKTESERRRQRMVEVYFDDGRGYGTWEMEKHRVPQEGTVSLSFAVPAGTKSVRLDPRSGPSLVRLTKLTFNGKAVIWTSNGTVADNGDLIFDTEDPQIEFEVPGEGCVCIRFTAEPLGGLGRELLLNQHGKLRWMEQTKVWRLYQKIKGQRE